LRENITVKIPATLQKLRGGYYTPESIAYFLADWAIQDPNTRVLEPSCGDGNILDAATQVLLRHGVSKAAIPQLVQGIEINANEANKAILRLDNRGICLSKQIYVGDFFSFCREQLLLQTKFDAIVGNPPFIRYQNFQEEHRWIAFQIMEHAGLRPTRLTNAWVPFVVASTLLLKENGGRIAMVIPAELLQVNYASELRQFLANFYTRITLVTFKKLVFEGIQQEIVLLLGERNGNERTGIRTVELNSIDELGNHQHTDFSATTLKPMDHSREKWTQYFLDQNEIDLLRRLRADDRLTKAKQVIDVDVGVVTGLNDFFVLPYQQAKDKALTPYTQPIVTRSGHLQGIAFTTADLLANMDKQFPCRILTAPNVPFDKLPESLRQYIAYGESMDFHKGYKCRIRNKWYVVPSLWAPDAFMLRQVHHYPKIILNETKATCTDTIHRVRFVSRLPAKLVASAFHNSLTFAFAEVVGRSYGGGVLELEPNEAETLPLPLKNAEKLDFDLINRLIIEGNIHEVLNITDKILLIEGLGLNHQDVLLLRSIWCKLRDRRVNRKHQKAKVVL
jgi:adenine-specific DNA-methyltransferase